MTPPRRVKKKAKPAYPEPYQPQLPPSWESFVMTALDRWRRDSYGQLLGAACCRRPSRCRHRQAHELFIIKMEITKRESRRKP